MAFVIGAVGIVFLLIAPMVFLGPIGGLVAFFAAIFALSKLNDWLSRRLGC